MVLSACNTSVSIDNDSATAKFKELSLSNLTGEDVFSIITLALNSIKIMQGAHYLPHNLATDLLIKCQNTKTEMFNRSVIIHYIIYNELKKWS